ncbi:inositol monophosphatase family protein [Staphylococcus condimenti]|uniref:inositol-phosphate phosphatase n=1 Tax=Staphylococcus condimenti TaxID=70255 RepID=A0A143PAN4_9STAP|nr:MULTISPECIES: inositol monophosphatase family protein [Staphylococcus]AMY05148.1 inositol monophosphatase [Staphylococcus condimenti]MDK8645740.1 inositol monophosphatase family protein [Staphylococcus condimenti]OFO99250.1 inositol monophosphatase [Staphylococcus sp. HMSC065E08]PNZ61025.1 inositol monophosphatase family protein [Staphylococcus condimenti]QQS83050.1 inositol monophosphatase family protein [Staphylococcus condimenti]
MAVYDYAKGLVIEAGNNIRKMMQEEIDIETKSNPNDLVTNVDKATEDFIYNNIIDNYPDAQVIGEEGHGKPMSELKPEGIVWVIDPIDGTLNFVHQQENFAISIGIYNDGKPYAGFVYDVMNDKLYHAKAGEGAFVNEHPLKPIADSELKKSLIGINPNWLTKPQIGVIFKKVVDDARTARAYGSAALEIVNVARGKLAAYMTPRLQPWDFAGGLIILNEVGGVGSDLLGKPLDLTQPHSVLVGNKAVHEEILNKHMLSERETLEALHARYKQ